MLTCRYAPRFFAQLIIKRYAGHSKWQNIRHTKAAKDSERSRLHNKVCQRISVAIQKNGSADPASNPLLRQVVELARINHVPNSVIEKYLNQTKLDTGKSRTFYYELIGPKGSFFIVEAFLENPNKTRTAINNIIKKVSLNFSSNLLNNFTHKGIIIARPKEKVENIETVSVDHAIFAGAEDVEHEPEENLLKFYCCPLSVIQVKDKLQELGYEILDADEHYLPNYTVPLADEYVESLNSAIEKISNLGEVVKVYDNVA